MRFGRSLMGTVVVALMVLAVPTWASRFIEDRAVEGLGPASELNVVGEESVCGPRSACGWEIYGARWRHVYYLRNQCRCPDNARCVRVDDDLQQEAYVYKCRRFITSYL